jgi:hypothetical protein
MALVRGATDDAPDENRGSEVADQCEAACGEDGGFDDGEQAGAKQRRALRASRSRYITLPPWSSTCLSR